MKQALFLCQSFGVKISQKKCELAFQIRSRWCKVRFNSSLIEALLPFRKRSGITLRLTIEKAFVERRFL